MSFFLCIIAEREAWRVFFDDFFFAVEIIIFFQRNLIKIYFYIDKRTILINSDFDNKQKFTDLDVVKTVV